MALTLPVQYGVLFFAALPGSLSLEPWWPGPPRTVEQWHVQRLEGQRRQLANVRALIARFEKDGRTDAASLRVLESLKAEEKRQEESVARAEEERWRPASMWHPTPVRIESGPRK